MRREFSASYVAEKAGYKTVDTLAGKCRQKLRFRGVNKPPDCSLRPAYIRLFQKHESQLGVKVP
jgi:hypothetical protein